ncbi:ATP-binding protein [Actinoplanes sp. LDG1-06]|uniref:ATP-binding protein n=1 Tax=Paractinoplanes ovalisporus TaxID=2810368 RepID=A0ABS2AB41_9ACTN|nr:ATP-binding protein [Actinoplanes ovalisporus]
MAERTWYDVSPSAARLTGSLRDIGYDFTTAVADIVDNSVAAGATRVEILVEHDGAESRVFITDDGCGMSAQGLLEALRFGTRRAYGRGELGRYGLGLKTASLSQCRVLTVVSRNSEKAVRVSARSLDLDLIEEWDQWVIVDPTNTEPSAKRARQWLSEGTGTVVIWEVLDRVLPEKKPEGGWARRRLETLAARTAEHLGMVFHRFIEGVEGRPQLVITVNGQKVVAWDPFARHESATQELPRQRFEVEAGGVVGQVALRRFVLPAKDRFSEPAEFERLSGPLNWNRQQGLYVYRADRLVQWGGWAGIRGIDEHTKLARASIEFDTDLDTTFNINVAKMRVTLPAQLKSLIEPAVNELCVLADDAYRKTSRATNTPVPANLGAPPEARAAAQAAMSAGLALRMAAMQADQWQAWEQIETIIREQSPDVAELLGLQN